jgi:tetratricopeptide (TPR) repeat protein
MRYLVVGWFWFLGLLVPVIGVVQVGRQSLADRYTYLPAVGIFIIVCWAAAEAIARWPRLARPVAVLAVAVLGGCCFLANQQVRLWYSTKTLFEHTVAVTGNNPVALTNLGLVAINEDRFDDAERILSEALKLDPQEMDAWGNLATLFRKQKKYEKAVQAYEYIDQLCPKNPKCYAQLASTLAEMKQYDRAEIVLRKALVLEPSSVANRFELAKVLDAQHKKAEALALYLFVLERHPDDVALRNNTAWIYATSANPIRDGAKAVALLEAVADDKRDGNLLDTLAAAYAAAGRFDEAVATAEQAIAKSRQESAAASAVADMEDRLAKYKKRAPYQEK